MCHGSVGSDLSPFAFMGVCFSCLKIATTEDSDRGDEGRRGRQGDCGPGGPAQHRVSGRVGGTGQGCRQCHCVARSQGVNGNNEMKIGNLNNCTKNTKAIGDVILVCLK